MARQCETGANEGGQSGFCLTGKKALDGQRWSGCATTQWEEEQYRPIYMRLVGGSAWCVDGEEHSGASYDGMEIYRAAASLSKPQEECHREAA